MMADINEVAEKKLKSRIRKLKKTTKSEEEKEKFFDQLGASFELFMPTKKPEEQNDSIILYTTAEGKIVDAEFSYMEIDENGEEQMAQIPLELKDLKVLVEALKDFELGLLE